MAIDLDKIATHVPAVGTPQSGPAEDVPSVQITLNVNELNTVLAALQELPHRVADPILKSVFTQAQAQLQARQVPKN